MLQEFLTDNRNALIASCRKLAMERAGSGSIPVAMDHGAPLFLLQLVDALAAEQRAPIREGAEIRAARVPNDIGWAAALHGAQLLQLGFTIDQVVRGYGDICQSVTSLAIKLREPISAVEFRTLNRCLDEAIAEAVTAFGQARHEVNNARAEALHQSLLAFTDDYQRLVDIALNAFNAIKAGTVGATGTTGALMLQTLLQLRNLAPDALSGVRLASVMTTMTGDTPHEVPE